jgi:pimeloyl-ACP methyl ester carboxylesterase
MKKIYISDKEKLINLPDFPYDPKYEKNITGFEEYEDMRMAYIDTGNKDSELTFLMLHGSPTWSYMWRHFIKEIEKANFRAVAFDMPGFGRSDKPLDEEAYTFTSLRSSLICMIERLNLKNIVLVVHEWGGFLGLTIPMDMPELFDGMIIHNTTLATGTNLMSDSYTDWRNYIRDNPDLNIRAIMARTNKILNLKECNNYHAPFDSYESKVALRVMPKIFPNNQEKEGAEISKKAQDWLSNEFNGLALSISGMRDPLFPQDALNRFFNSINGINNLPGVDNAGHFLPEWAMEYGKNLINQYLLIREKYLLAMQDTEKEEDDISNV